MSPRDVAPGMVPAMSPVSTMLARFSRPLRMVALAGLLSNGVAPAHADPSASEVLRRPLAPYGTDYLSGLTDGMAWINAKKGGQPLYCLPPNVSILPAQYREVLRRKVEATPALADAHAGYVLMLALAEAFPCPVKP